MFQTQLVYIQDNENIVFNILSHARPIKMFRKYFQSFRHSKMSHYPSTMCFPNKQFTQRAVRYTQLIFLKQKFILKIKFLKRAQLTFIIFLPKSQSLAQSNLIWSKPNNFEVRLDIKTYLLESASATTFSFPCLQTIT